MNRGLMQTRKSRVRRVGKVICYIYASSNLQYYCFEDDFKDWPQ